MTTREYVEYLLKNYNEIKCEIELLKLELKQRYEVTPVDIIQVLNFRKPQGERVQTSGTSDKTGNVAMVFKKLAQRLNETEERDIKKSITATELEIARLDVCIEHLDDRLQRAIRCLYFEKKSWRETCSEIYISEKTLSKYRKKALKEITTMMEHKKLVV